MTGYIKAIGIAIIAIVALPLLTTSGAIASELHLASSGNVSIFGEQTAQDQQSKFQFGASGVVQCTEALLEGTQTGSGSGTQTTTSELTLTPTYTGCTAFGLAASIDMNGCKYTVTGSGQPALSALVDIVGCTTGKSIEITSPATGCTRTILAINGLAHVVFSNVAGSPSHMTIQLTLGSVQYETHGCSIFGGTDTVKTNDSTIGGQTTVRGREDVGTEQKTHNGHQYNKLKQSGALVGLVAT
jgi:hypothetical protein